MSCKTLGLAYNVYVACFVESCSLDLRTNGALCIVLLAKITEDPSDPRKVENFHFFFFNCCTYE